MFSKKFVDLLQSQNITAYKVAKDTGISQGLMNEYKSGKKNPTIQNLKKISDYLGVPVGYFLGEDTTQGMINYELFPVKAAIFSPIKSGDITKEDFCRQVGISDYTLYQWRNNGSTSYLDKLPEIAGALGVSVDKLLGKSFSSDDQRNSYILSLKHFQSQADEAFPELFGSSKMTITVTAEEFSLIEAYRTKSDEIKAAARGLLGVTAVRKD